MRAGGDLTIPGAESHLAESRIVRPRELHNEPEEAALTVVLHDGWLFPLGALSFTFSTDTAGLSCGQQTSRACIIRVLRGVIALSERGGEGGVTIIFHFPPSPPH